VLLFENLKLRHQLRWTRFALFAFAVGALAYFLSDR
jgi:hypothetical protein